jgi:hypothetical protein
MSILTWILRGIVQGDMSILNILSWMLSVIDETGPRARPHLPQLSGLGTPAPHQHLHPKHSRDLCHFDADFASPAGE